MSLLPHVDFAGRIASAGGGRNANIEVATLEKLGAMGESNRHDEVLADTLSGIFSREGF